MKRNLESEREAGSQEWGQRSNSAYRMVGMFPREQSKTLEASSVKVPGY